MRALRERLLRPATRFTLVATIVLAGLLSLMGSGGGGDDPDPPYTPRQGTSTMGLTPISQQTEVWCWAAAAEMVFRHYGLPNLNPSGNYQCGIVAIYYGPNSSCWFDCFTCVQAIGPVSQMQALINGYGIAASQFTPSRVLNSTLVFSPLTFADTAREVDSGRPIVAGISPTGYAYPNLSQHFIVIVGYQNTGAAQSVIVNDPFPYDAFPANPNPYDQAGATRTRPGQYLVPYTTLVSRLQWANTIYQIR